MARTWSTFWPFFRLVWIFLSESLHLFLRNLIIRKIWPKSCINIIMFGFVLALRQFITTEKPLDNKNPVMYRCFTLYAIVAGFILVWHFWNHIIRTQSVFAKLSMLSISLNSTRSMHSGLSSARHERVNNIEQLFHDGTNDYPQGHFEKNAISFLEPYRQ